MFIYKGYKGSCEYSEEDRCWWGKLLDVGNDLITYEAYSRTFLRLEFRAAVRDYIRTIRYIKRLHK